MRGDAAVCLAREQHTEELSQSCLETVSPWGHESPGALYVVSQNRTLGTRCRTWEHGPVAYAGRHGVLCISLAVKNMSALPVRLNESPLGWLSLKARDRAGSTGQRVLARCFRNRRPGTAGLHGQPGLACSQPGMLPIRPGLSVAEDAHKRERGPCMTGQNSQNP